MSEPDKVWRFFCASPELSWILLRNSAAKTSIGQLSSSIVLRSVYETDLNTSLFQFFYAKIAFFLGTNTYPLFFYPNMQIYSNSIQNKQLPNHHGINLRNSCNCSFVISFGPSFSLKTTGAISLCSTIYCTFIKPSANANEPEVSPNPIANQLAK